jgi:N-acetyl-gamma-glutamyl-phosphate reductase
MELVRILAGHPSLRLSAAASRGNAGSRLEEVYPFLRGLPCGGIVLTAPDASSLAAECDVIFLAVPHGVAMETGAALYDAGARVVDLSADFRLRDASVFTAWYKTVHSRPDLLASAVYGLPELNAPAIRESRLVANPGCYPTASILALYPALRHDLIRADDIVIDAKSGASGAGRALEPNMLFCEVQDSFRPYKLGQHRHTPEIEQELSLLAGKALTVSFNPHLLPVNRGILATIYTRLKKSVPQEEIQALFEQTWAGSPWVRVLPPGRLPETRNVRGTMFCDVAVVADTRADRLIIVSAIDNLCRGASGQAVANANLMCGLPPADGLSFAPLLP